MAFAVPIFSDGFGHTEYCLGREKNQKFSTSRRIFTIIQKAFKSETPLSTSNLSRPDKWPKNFLIELPLEDEGHRGIVSQKKSDFKNITGIDCFSNIWPKYIYLQGIFMNLNIFAHTVTIVLLVSDLKLEQQCISTNFDSFY